jgi:signal transduction histidine kinase/ligand-binding sensor domain-containing protein
MLGVVSCLYVVQPAIAQGVSIDNYVVTQWGMEQGLPQSSVNDLLQSQDGYIWFATFGGLVRFDGINFTTYDRSNTPGLRSDRILDLFEDSKGALWLGTEDGITRFENGVGTTYIIREGLLVYSATIMREDKLGNLWFVIHGQPYTFVDGDFKRVPIQVDEDLARRAMSDENGIWLHLETTVVRTIGDSVVLVHDFENLLNQYIDVDVESNLVGMYELPNQDGAFLLATTRTGIFRIHNDDIYQFTEADGLPSLFIRRFYVDNNETPWIPAYNGLSIWNGNSFSNFHFTDISRIQVTSILHDSDGNYWIGTSGDGLFKVRQSIISTISREDGLFVDIMLSQKMRRDGSAILATNCGGIYELRNEQLRYVDVNEHLPNLCIWSVFEDSKNRIWIGSRQLYQTKSLDEPGEIINGKQGFLGVDIYAIMEDSKGMIWIGGQNGLSRFDGTHYTHYTDSNGLSHNDARYIFEDSKGVLWVGTTAGLNTYSDGKFHRVSLHANAEPSAPTPEPYVRAIHEDKDGAIWIGTYGNGIYRLKDGKIINISQRNGLFDNIVSHIVEDQGGNFWMGSNRGIFRVSSITLNGFADGDLDMVQSYSFGTKDGMKSAETNGGFQPNVMTDHEGNLYFPTVRGVAIVATQSEIYEYDPPRVLIERLQSGDTELSLTEKVVLQHDNAFIEIQYTAISFREPEKIKFKYQLEGLSDLWFDVGNRRTALYTKLPPGEYKFRVIASNPDGIWNTESAKVSITVLPPFWATAWFRGLLAVIFISTVYITYYTRLSVVKKEKDRQKRFTEQLLESQESERRRIASELHDGLGQQILVIKNRAELATLQNQNGEDTAEQLKEIVKSAVISISEVRTITHGLRPVHLEQLGLTESLIFMCDQIQQTSSTKWSYHIDNIDDLIPQNKEIHFYRVLQEGISNIEKHAQANEASITIKRESSAIITTIWDNGVGFVGKDSKSFAGLGFLGMYERIETLGGKLDVSSEPGSGSIILVELPIAPVFFKNGYMPPRTSTA